MVVKEVGLFDLDPSVAQVSDGHQGVVHLLDPRVHDPGEVGLSRVPRDRPVNQRLLPRREIFHLLGCGVLVYQGLLSMFIIISIIQYLLPTYRFM